MNDLKDLLTRKKTAEKDKEAGAVVESEMDLNWPQTAIAYELKAQIGQGAFAKVWQAWCPEKNTDVAIKIMELDNLTSSLDDIYQEVRVMLLSKNPSVLRAYACFVVKRSLWLVMPLMRKGSCLRIMKVLKRMGMGEGMKEEWIAAILKATLLGLEYFHQQGKLHRDIKASNLLMDSDGAVRISDFGVAGWLPNGSQDRNESERRTFVGTICWMAPEVMEQTRPYDEKADIWSFGITALELAKGYAPYARLQPMKVLLTTIQNPPPSLKTYEDYQSTKSKFSRHFREIVTLCLQKNPANRPSASTLLSKTFFKRAPAPSFLVKDLLEAVPIPDTCESSGGHPAPPKAPVTPALPVTSMQETPPAAAPGAKPAAAVQPAPPVASEATQGSGLATADATVADSQPAAPPAAGPAASLSGANASQAAAPAAAPAQAQEEIGEAVPATSVPDMGLAQGGAPAGVEGSAKAVAGPDAAVDKRHRLIQQLAEREKSSSFVKGSTWVFDDEPADEAAAPAAGAAVPPEQSGDAAQAVSAAATPAAAPAVASAAADSEDLNDFGKFAVEFAEAGVFGEDGKPQG